VSRGLDVLERSARSIGGQATIDVREPLAAAVGVMSAVIAAWSSQPLGGGCCVRADRYRGVIWRTGAPAAIGRRRRRRSRIVPPNRMPKITYIDHEGTARTVEGELGSTVMETAIKNGIPGIEAECGGACACATCHVHVDDAWRATVGEPSPMEEDMLDFGYDVKPNSRLSCQIKVTAELEGLVVRTPERQA
jgi:2Fe-2S ferredoxin